MSVILDLFGAEPLPILNVPAAGALNCGGAKEPPPKAGAAPVPKLGAAVAPKLKPPGLGGSVLAPKLNAASFAVLLAAAPNVTGALVFPKLRFDGFAVLVAKGALGNMFEVCGLAAPKAGLVADVLKPPKVGDAAALPKPPALSKPNDGVEATPNALGVSGLLAPKLKGGFVPKLLPKFGGFPLENTFAGLVTSAVVAGVPKVGALLENNELVTVVVVVAPANGVPNTEAAVVVTAVPYAGALVVGVPKTGADGVAVRNIELAVVVGAPKIVAVVTAPNAGGLVPKTLVEAAVVVVVPAKIEGAFDFVTPKAGTVEF